MQAHKISIFSKMNKKLAFHEIYVFLLLPNGKDLPLFKGFSK